jgi:hypothetical protein
MTAVRSPNEGSLTTELPTTTMRPWSSITTENTLGRLDFSPVVKNRARDLLRAVADGGDVPIARINDFARAVIEAPAFQVAQEILEGGSPELAVCKVLELASMVLSADDGAADSGSHRRSAMKKDRSGTLAR